MINSFCYSIALTVIAFGVGMVCFQHIPLVPDYAARFENDAVALVLELLLIGVMSAVLAGGTVIMELERLGLLVQSILYFVVTSPVWLAVACYCFGFAKYPMSAVSVCVSYFVSYSVCWIVQYKTCKRNIEDINRALQKLGQDA